MHYDFCVEAGTDGYLLATAPRAFIASLNEAMLPAVAAARVIPEAGPGVGFIPMVDGGGGRKFLAVEPIEIEAEDALWVGRLDSPGPGPPSAANSPKVDARDRPVAEVMDD